MYLIRVDRGHSDGQAVTLWLKTAKPVRLAERDQAMTFRTKGEAMRVAADAKLVGWTLEEA